MDAPLQFGTVQPGQAVLTADSVHVGVVKEVEPPVMLVDRPLQRDIYIPLDDVDFLLESDAEDEPWVILELTEDQMSVMDWESPPLLGG